MNLYTFQNKTNNNDKTLSKSKSKIKGYADIEPGHRTNFGGRSQGTMAKFFKSWEILPNPNGAEEANWEEMEAEQRFVMDKLGISRD